MKRITVLCIATIACLLTIAAQSDTDSAQVNVTETQIEYTDTPAAGSTLRRSEKKYSDEDESTSREDFDLSFGIPALALICVFGMPVLIVAIASYFNYKKRKTKYQLVEKALASGQPLSEEILRSLNSSSGNTLSKGITNTFAGIGLFIFLWAITNEFSIGTIGLLVMFMGFGQIVIHYAQENKKRNTDNRKDN